MGDSLDTYAAKFIDMFTIDEHGCWIWNGPTHPDGLPEFRTKGATFFAGRLAHELFRGPLSSRRRLKRRCLVRLCVNPDHTFVSAGPIMPLRPVLPAGHCRNGHVYSEGTFKVRESGSRECLICRRINEKRNRTGPKRSPKTVTERFVDGFTINDDGCWVWDKATWNGSARFSIDGVGYQAHRIGYMLFVGPVPPDEDLVHLCRVKLCVNPDHMSIGYPDDWCYRPKK